MAALTCDRGTHRRPGNLYRDPVMAGAMIHAGAMVMLDPSSGMAVPAYGKPTLIARGMALKAVDNRQGSMGDAFVDVEAGVFGLKTDGTIDRSFIGQTVCFIDDQTVSATGAPVAGILKDLEGEGHGATAWVQVG